MTSYFMIVSILIHIITISAIIILNKGYKRLSRQSRKNATNTSEIMDIMKNYLDEIKQENSFLQQELLKSRSNVQDNPNKTSEIEINSRIEPKSVNQVISDSETKLELEPKKRRESIEKEGNKDSFQFFLPKKEVQDDVEVSLQSRIMKLHKEGYTVEEIARTVGCGTTEAELIIKIHEKNNI